MALARRGRGRDPNRRPRAVRRRRTATGVRIKTSAGDIEARTAIVAAGPWLKELLPDLPAPLRATREVMAWFKPRDPGAVRARPLPGVHPGEPPRHALRLSAVAGAAPSRSPSITTTTKRSIPTTRGGRCPTTDEALIRPALESHIPAANGPLAAAKTCIYTMTPDHDFIIDRLPGAPNIIVASPCSGHGFKFAPVIGEILADLATEGGTAHDIRPLPAGPVSADTLGIAIGSKPTSIRTVAHGGMPMLGLMQDWPLLCHRIIDHAAIQHGDRAGRLALGRRADPHDQLRRGPRSAR